MSGIIPTPFIFVIFGATGDLTKRKLIPALYSLYRMKLLPKEFRIYAFARRPFTDESFVETLKPFIDKNTLDEFLEFSIHITYIQGDFTDSQAYEKLRQATSSGETIPNCLSRLYYMAVSPDVLPQIFEQLGQHGLHTGCGEEGHWTRVVVEKPFGHDLESAQALNQMLLKYFKEEQIYRIDHYLGKETVQNILTTRFANTMFQPVWCRDFIDHIQITASETLGVEERGGYYDQAGALRDFVQSHLLQIVALVAMREPDRYDADVIREQKNLILQALRPFTKDSIKTDSVRAQYTSYVHEERISPTSKTETYVAMKLFIDLPEWKDVPIYIRTGKKLDKRSTEIHVKFKKAEAKVFSNLFCELRSNTLSIQLQPDEGIHLRVLIKEPGFAMKLSAVDLGYSYKDTFNHLPDAYERLLLDAMNGDQSLFTRTDEIESSWVYVTNMLNLWQSENVPLQTYESGTKGPEAADVLMTRDKKYWIN
jgi:glucose-6-phosphate 1-dehydrogenase